MLKDNSIYTQAVHAGERGPRPDFTAVSTPIQQSVGYLYDDMVDLDGVFGGTREGYVYPRYGSPTVNAFEWAVATLEGAEDAVAFASGMGAIHAALMGAGVQAGTAVVAAADVYVVPMRMGSGTRFKVLEAMAMKRAIVSTTLGAQGLEAENGRHLLVGDDPTSFAGAVVALLTDEVRRASLGEQAHAFVAEGYDWGRIIPRLEAIYEPA